MKKLIFILTMVLTTGIVAAQTEIRKKDYKIYKPSPALLLYAPTGAINAQIDFNNDILLLQTANLLSVRGGDLSLVNNNLLGSGSIGATGSRFTKAWATEVEANVIAITAGDTTVTAVLGRIVYKTSDNHFYGCIKTTMKKWKQLDN